MDNKRLVSFRTFSNERDAEIVRHQMQTHGYDAVVTKADWGKMLPLLQKKQGIFLQVFEHDSHGAKNATKPLKS